VWITLLTTAHEAPQALEIQGFGWNARKMDREKSPLKSTACNRYGFCSRGGASRAVVQRRNTTFVHKSSAPAPNFQALVS
jgi:hypothetical protein